MLQWLQFPSSELSTSENDDDIDAENAEQITETKK